MDRRFEWFDEEKVGAPIDPEVAERAEEIYEKSVTAANAIVAVAVAATDGTHAAALALTLARAAIFRASVEQEPASRPALESLDNIAANPFSGPFTVSFQPGNPVLVPVPREDDDG
jgi:hypothetical protein